MADSKTRSKKGKLEELAPFWLGEPNPEAAERAREIKRRQRERGISFSDSTGMVRVDRDSR